MASYSTTVLDEVLNNFNRISAPVHSDMPCNGSSFPDCTSCIWSQWVCVSIWAPPFVLTFTSTARFVPFAIFVCSASLFIIVVLWVNLPLIRVFSKHWLINGFSLVFSLFLRERNPISTRIELASLGLAGMFWLGALLKFVGLYSYLHFVFEVLGVFLATSDSQSADVECFASDTATEPLDDSMASCESPSDIQSSRY